MEFPILVYRDGGSFQRKGGTYSYKQVNDDEQLQQARADGWFDSLEAAINPESAAPTRAELEEKANELGLKFDGRTSDKKLALMIAEKL